jgi:DNA repair ATPase RecN
MSLVNPNLFDVKPSAGVELIDQVGATLQTKLRDAYGRRAVRQAALDRVAKLMSIRDEIDRAVVTNDQAKLVIQAIEQHQHEQLKQRVEGVVSFALKTIFERDLRLEVEFDTRGNQTEAKFKLRDERDNLVSLKDAHGGGLLVVATFVLRVVVLMSIRPQLRPFLVVDEPFVHVSEEYRDKLVAFIRSLAESSGLQFLIVTHLPELAQIGDRRYRFALKDGVTQVTELEPG